MTTAPLLPLAFPDHGVALTSGQSMLDVIEQTLAEVGTPAELDVLSAAANAKHVQRLADLRAAGTLSAVRLIIDADTLRMRASHGNMDAEKIERAIGRDSVRGIRAHAHAVQLRGPLATVSYLTSGNLNRFMRPEVYERLEAHEGVRAVMDAAWGGVKAGAHLTGAEAYAATDRLMLDLGHPEIVTVRQAEKCPTLEDGETILATYDVAMMSIIPEVLRIIGPAAAHCITYYSTARALLDLEQLVKDGALTSAHVTVPARFGRRKTYAQAYAVLVARLPHRFSRAHAKIAVLIGEERAAVISGSVNLSPMNRLELVRVRFVTPETARAVLADVDNMPDEPAPPPPTEEAAEWAERQRLPRAKTTRAIVTTAGAESQSDGQSQLARLLAEPRSQLDILLRGLS